MDRGAIHKERVTVISDTKQSYRGVSYYRYENAYQCRAPKGVDRRLHRVVWISHNGAIEDGKRIYHIDSDVSNNQIENLFCSDYKKERYKCAWCEDWYDGGSARLPGRPCFCSPLCAARCRRDSGVYEIEARCRGCNKAYKTNKYNPRSFCRQGCKRESGWKKVGWVAPDSRKRLFFNFRWFGGFKLRLGRIFRRL